MQRLVASLVLLAVFVPGLASASPVDLSTETTPRAPVSVLVTLEGAVFTPNVLVVPAGSTVTWQYVEAPLGVHTVTTGPILTDNAEPNDPTNSDADPDTFNFSLNGPGLLPTLSGPSRSHTFNAAGTFTYFCTPHYMLGMRAVVVVV